MKFHAGVHDPIRTDFGGSSDFSFTAAVTERFVL